VDSPQRLDLSPEGAVQWIRDELDQARKAVEEEDLDAALDAYIPTLGLALQLGPAPAEQVLSAILATAQRLVLCRDAEGLSVLGPALVGLTGRVREANVLPQSTVMEAWAAVVEGMGALIGQLGLVLTLPPERRGEMATKARAHAVVLDDATSSIFGLERWIDGMAV
jgi:hypothetical protein